MKIYFVGIGGCSMSALAVMLKARGYSVRGADRVEGSAVQALRAQGIAVSIGHSESVAGNDLVVYTCGVPWDNAQLAQARALGIPILERAEVLGLLAREYSPVIAVAGTHGKTTTAALVSAVLARFSPTLHLGGEGSKLGGGMLVTEACEYRNSFLTLAPDVGVVLNAESDHPDFFRSEQEVVASFCAFSRNVRADGLLIVGQGMACRACAQSARARTVVLGEDLRAEEVSFDGSRLAFDLAQGGARLARIESTLCGTHYVTDILAACAIGLYYNVPMEDIQQAVAHFTGVRRRWERVGCVKGVAVIADYAHHPTQIAACLDAARQGGGRVRVLFQPHTYSRTRALFADFCKALSKADGVALIDVYAARETVDTGASSEVLCKGVRDCGGSAEYFTSNADAVRAVASGLRAGDIVLVLGAGDVYRLSFDVVNVLEGQ